MLPAPRASPARARASGLDWRAALRSGRTFGILARAMIPVAGVVLLDWSGLRAIAFVALDTLAGLWAVVAAAAVLVGREHHWERDRDLYQTVVTALVTFVLVAGLMTVAVGVVAFMIGASILEQAQFDPGELLEGGWLFYSMAGLCVMHVPEVRSMLAQARGNDPKSVLEPRTGFLLRRLVLAALACSLLSFLWGRAAILGALVVTQLVIAAHEVFGERLHQVLFPEPPKDSADSAPRPGRKRGKRRS